MRKSCKLWLRRAWWSRASQLFSFPLHLLGMIFDSSLLSHSSLISIFLWPQVLLPPPCPWPSYLPEGSPVYGSHLVSKAVPLKKRERKMFPLEVWLVNCIQLCHTSVSPPPFSLFFPDRYERIGLELWEKFSVSCWGCLVMSLGLWKAKDLGSWWREGKMGEGREEKYRQGEEFFKKKKKVQVLWTCTMILWTQRSLELVSKFLIHFQTELIQ